jgi:hypothetical protein
MTSSVARSSSSPQPRKHEGNASFPTRDFQDFLKKGHETDSDISDNDEKKTNPYKRKASKNDQDSNKSEFGEKKRKIWFPSTPEFVSTDTGSLYSSNSSLDDDDEIASIARLHTGIPMRLNKKEKSQIMKETYFSEGRFRYVQHKAHPVIRAPGKNFQKGSHNLTGKRVFVRKKTMSFYQQVGTNSVTTEARQALGDRSGKESRYVQKKVSVKYVDGKKMSRNNQALLLRLKALPDEFDAFDKTYITLELEREKLQKKIKDRDISNEDANTEIYKTRELLRAAKESGDGNKVKKYKKLLHVKESECAKKQKKNNQEIFCIDRKLSELEYKVENLRSDLTQKWQKFLSSCAKEKCLRHFINDPKMSSIMNFTSNQVEVRTHTQTTWTKNVTKSGEKVSGYKIVEPNIQFIQFRPLVAKWSSYEQEDQRMSPTAIDENEFEALELFFENIPASSTVGIHKLKFVPVLREHSSTAYANFGDLGMSNGRSNSTESIPLQMKENLENSLISLVESIERAQQQKVLSFLDGPSSLGNAFNALTTMIENTPELDREISIAIQERIYKIIRNAGSDGSRTGVGKGLVPQKKSDSALGGVGDDDPAVMRNPHLRSGTNTSGKFVPLERKARYYPCGHTKDGKIVVVDVPDRRGVSHCNGGYKTINDNAIAHAEGRLPVYSSYVMDDADAADTPLLCVFSDDDQSEAQYIAKDNEYNVRNVMQNCVSYAKKTGSFRFKEKRRHVDFGNDMQHYNGCCGEFMQLSLTSGPLRNSKQSPKVCNSIIDMLRYFKENADKLPYSDADLVAQLAENVTNLVENPNECLQIINECEITFKAISAKSEKQSEAVSKRGKGVIGKRFVSSKHTTSISAEDKKREFETKCKGTSPTILTEGYASVDDLLSHPEEIVMALIKNIPEPCPFLLTKRFDVSMVGGKWYLSVANSSADSDHNMNENFLKLFDTVMLHIQDNSGRYMYTQDGNMSIASALKVFDHGREARIIGMMNANPQPTEAEVEKKSHEWSNKTRACSWAIKKDLHSSTMGHIWDECDDKYERCLAQVRHDLTGRSDSSNSNDSRYNSAAFFSAIEDPTIENLSRIGIYNSNKKEDSISKDDVEYVVFTHWSTNVENDVKQSPDGLLPIGALHKHHLSVAGMWENRSYGMNLECNSDDPAKQCETAFSDNNKQKNYDTEWAKNCVQILPGYNAYGARNFIIILNPQASPPYSLRDLCICDRKKCPRMSAQEAVDSQTTIGEIIIKDGFPAIEKYFQDIQTEASNDDNDKLLELFPKQKAFILGELRCLASGMKGPLSLKIQSQTREIDELKALPAPHSLWTDPQDVDEVWDPEKSTEATKGVKAALDSVSSYDERLYVYEEIDGVVSCKGKNGYSDADRAADIKKLGKTYKNAHRFPALDEVKAVWLSKNPSTTAIGACKTRDDFNASMPLNIKNYLFNEVILTCANALTQEEINSEILSAKTRLGTLLALNLPNGQDVFNAAAIRPTDHNVNKEENRARFRKALMNYPYWNSHCSTDSKMDLSEDAKATRIRMGGYEKIHSVKSSKTKNLPEFKKAKTFIAALVPHFIADDELHVQGMREQKEAADTFGKTIESFLNFEAYEASSECLSLIKKHDDNLGNLNKRLAVVEKNIANAVAGGTPLALTTEQANLKKEIADSEKNKKAPKDILESIYSNNPNLRDKADMYLMSLYKETFADEELGGLTRLNVHEKFPQLYKKLKDKNPNFCAKLMIDRTTHSSTLEGLVGAYSQAKYDSAKLEKEIKNVNKNIGHTKDFYQLCPELMADRMIEQEKYQERTGKLEDLEQSCLLMKDELFEIGGGCECECLAAIGGSENIVNSQDPSLTDKAMKSLEGAGGKYIITSVPAQDMKSKDIKKQEENVKNASDARLDTDIRAISFRKALGIRKPKSHTDAVSRASGGVRFRPHGLSIEAAKSFSAFNEFTGNIPDVPQLVVGNNSYAVRMIPYENLKNNGVAFEIVKDENDERTPASENSEILQLENFVSMVALFTKDMNNADKLKNYYNWINPEKIGDISDIISKDSKSCLNFLNMLKLLPKKYWADPVLGEKLKQASDQIGKFTISLSELSNTPNIQTQKMRCEALSKRWMKVNNNNRCEVASWHSAKVRSSSWSPKEDVQYLLDGDSSKSGIGLPLLARAKGLTAFSWRDTSCSERNALDLVNKTHTKDTENLLNDVFKNEHHLGKSGNIFVENLKSRSIPHVNLTKVQDLLNKTASLKRNMPSCDTLEAQSKNGEELVLVVLDSQASTTLSVVKKDGKITPPQGATYMIKREDSDVGNVAIEMFSSVTNLLNNYINDSKALYKDILQDPSLKEDVDQYLGEVYDFMTDFIGDFSKLMRSKIFNQNTEGYIMPELMKIQVYLDEIGDIIEKKERVNVLLLSKPPEVSDKPALLTEQKVAIAKAREKVGQVLIDSES